MSLESSPLKESVVDMSDMITAPAGRSLRKVGKKTKKYSFSRWKKMELLDLCEKLKLDDISTSATKTVVIDLVERYLASLAHPLDTEIEFPELKDYFDSVQPASDEEHVAPIVVEKENNNDATNYNTLNFKENEISGNDDETPFKFNLQERFCDIVESTKILNENVQDFFSSLITITIIFQIIEALLLIKNKTPKGGS